MEYTRSEGTLAVPEAAPPSQHTRVDAPAEAQLVVAADRQVKGHPCGQWLPPPCRGPSCPALTTSASLKGGGVPLRRNGPHLLHSLPQPAKCAAGASSPHRGAANSPFHSGVCAFVGSSVALPRAGQGHGPSLAKAGGGNGGVEMCNQPLPRTLWRGAISHAADSRSVGSRNGCAVRPRYTTQVCGARGPEQELV